MASHTRTIATLIGSRICHDLISPIGAIQNGIELLTMEGKTGPEVALIEDSVRNASARTLALTLGAFPALLMPLPAATQTSIATVAL
ncbi:MAG: hypothetical protein ACPH5G_13525, partial [Pseudooceanicola atlanticus]